MKEENAVAILIALINRGDIELPCLNAFKAFRNWEVKCSDVDIKRLRTSGFANFLDTERPKLAKMAANLDAEYLLQFVSVLCNEEHPDKNDAWNFINDLRHLEKEIRAAQVNTPEEK